MQPRLIVPIALCLSLASATAHAQYYQTDFPAEEFRARHARVFEQIGATAVAVVQGVSQTEGYTLPRQHNTFYYRYYVSDIGRVFPVNGKYNAWQRELLQFVLEYHKA